MQKITQIGSVNWTNEEIKSSIPEFLELYKSRPISDNQGGMKSPHMFATWFLLKKLNPKIVIESGIWKGQGTWLIEKTLPEAKVYSIDVNLSHRQWISENVEYFNKDFSKIDWSFIKDKSSTLLFFDDHQNAYKRIIEGKKLGFKQFVFEDNYPIKHGDCYSLKKAFQHAGFTPLIKGSGLKPSLKKILKRRKDGFIKPNAQDAEHLRQILDIYYEFPPVFKKDQTRWKDKWDEVNYPTSEPLYTKREQEYLEVFEQEAIFYNWICLARLK